MKNVQIDRLTVVDSGGGNDIANAATQRVNAALAALEQVAGAMGIDVEQRVRRLAPGVPARAGDGAAADSKKG